MYSGSCSQRLAKIRRGTSVSGRALARSNETGLIGGRRTRENP
jgi:hypothetical protein